MSQVFAYVLLGFVFGCIFMAFMQALHEQRREELRQREQAIAERESRTFTHAGTFRG